MQNLSGIKRSVSYIDSVIGTGGIRGKTGKDPLNDDDVSADDVVKNRDDPTWFGFGITREEKIEVRRPWRNSLIIKLIGRSIGYHYLWKSIQAMWRTQEEPLLIDLGYDFFIIKQGRREKYDRALLEGP